MKKNEVKASAIKLARDAQAADAPKVDRQFVTALARGLEILRCFTPSTRELGTADIARLTGLPQPTVWRLCHTLSTMGFLQPAAGGTRLRPGIAGLSLGFAVLADQPLAEIARPWMAELALRHQGAVSLGARDGNQMVYLQRCQGSAIVMPHTVGTRVPMSSTATGWAYLAGLPPQEREQMMDELAVIEGANWSKLQPKIRKALRGYDQLGYVVNRGSMHAQINAVAVPFRTPDGGQLLSLSSGGINHVFDDAALAKIGQELQIFVAQLSPAFAPTKSNVSKRQH